MKEGRKEGRNEGGRKEEDDSGDARIASRFEEFHYEIILREK
jgi:hypothetical protein